MKTEEKNHDSEYSLSAVPSHMKLQGLFSVMVVLVGFTFFTPSRRNPWSWHEWNELPSVYAAG